MKINYRIYALLLAVATAGCAHQVPAYVPTPRPQIPPLPVDLAQKKDSSSCRKLLKAFSTPLASSDKACSIETPSSMRTTGSAPPATH